MKKPLALQLYSLRTTAQENFPAVLETVAGIGYCGVEFAGFHGYNINDLSHIVQDFGLKAVASHVPMPGKDNIAQFTDEASIIGCRTLISGFGPDDMKTADGLASCIEKFNIASALARSNGLRFCLHNHWWEFDNVFDGTCAFDTVMARTPAMSCELDTYWATKAGVEPLSVLAKWQDRIPLLHVKDGLFTPQLTHVAVGSGKMDFKKILTSELCSKVEWFVVELDSCESDMIEAVKQSYRFLVDNDLGVGSI